jgi:hypothetical protein
MQTSRRLAGLALVIFTAGTCAALTMSGGPAGNYDLGQLHAYLAPDARVTIFAGAVIGVLSAVALPVYLSVLRAEMPPGRGRDVTWGSGIAATATAAVGWVIAAAIPIAYAEGGGHVALTPSIVYTIGIISAQMIYGPTMLLAGLALIIAARQVRAAPRWWRNLGYIGGACAILSTAYFPMYLFLAYGIGIGVWGLATGGRRMTAADPRALTLRARGAACRQQNRPTTPALGRSTSPGPAPATGWRL